MLDQRATSRPDYRSQPSAWTRVALLADLRGDGPFALSADGVDLALVRTRTGLHAFQGRCPHQGALLGEGELDGGTLICRNHRWQFDAATGQRTGGPQCLVACPVDVRGTEVWVDVAPLRRADDEQPGSAATRRVDDLPGPRGLPIVGNLFQIDLPRFHLIVERWAREYGPAFRYRLGPHTIVAVSEPSISEQVLRARPDTYRRASNLEPVFEEMGLAGVFSAEGAEWRSQRRLAMEALSQRNLKGFYTTLHVVTRRLRTRWERKAAAGAVLDVAEELKRFTVDVTTALVFGHDVNTIEQDDDDVIQRKLGLVFPALNRRLFALVPTWRWLRLPHDRRLDRALAELRAWLDTRIGEARMRLRADPARAERPENFLESMIAARDAEGRPFSDDVIFGNAMTMLLAGEDTTAYTLTWAVHHLCDAAHAAARLRDEADAVSPNGIARDLETANRLTFAGAVANETMRLRPVAPVLLFEALRDVVVADIAVPKGMWVATLSRPPALDDRHFANAKTFQPERWLSNADAAHGVHDPSAHVPFGSGPRICPGRTLALLEMKVVLSMLFGAFDVERVGDAAAVRERFAFTMYPDGVRVRLHARSTEQSMSER